MYKKLLFITMATLLVGHKSIVGIATILVETEKEDFHQHLALYSDASSSLSSVPVDKRNCELALLLSELQYENGNSPLHFAASIGDMPLALHLLAQAQIKTRLIYAKRRHAN